MPYDISKIKLESDLPLDPNYIAGFVAADGSFFIQRPSSKAKWPNYDATFSIAQNQTDIGLLKRILAVLGCGTIKSEKEIWDMFQ